MPNNKKKKKSKQRGGGAGGSTVNGGPRVFRTGQQGIAEPEYFREPIAHRPVPEMKLDGSLWRKGIMSVPEGERSATVERYRKAYVHIDQVGDYLKNRGVGENPDMDTLLSIPGYVQHCERLIEAVVLSDFHAGIPMVALRDLRLPSCCATITANELEPLENTANISIANVSAKAWVVLLASAIKLQHVKPAFGLHIVFELHAQDERGSIDWSVYGTDGDGLSMSRSQLRFALAYVGIKCARHMYREKDSRQAMPYSSKLSSKFLLSTIETFSREQCEYHPQHPAGNWNLGWVDTQNAAKRGMDGLQAAADCLEHMTACYELADEYDDDFFKCMGRLEAAFCLVLGAGGMVGYSIAGGRGHTQRDMRTNHRHKRPEGSASGSQAVPICIQAFGDSPQVERAVIEKERRRVEQDVAPTVLDDGETVLVARWDVLKLWNHAMVHYDKLKSIGHGPIVYGETMGWDGTYKFLTMTTNSRYDEYANITRDPGFPKERDKGFGYSESLKCAACGKRDAANSVCRRCKKVAYCNRECQLTHWTEHKQVCKSA